MQGCVCVVWGGGGGLQGHKPRGLVWVLLTVGLGALSLGAWGEAWQAPAA